MPEAATVAGLTRDEARQARQRAGRELSALEWAILAVQWSEHCAYKHSKELLRSLPKDGAHVMAGPGASAGVLDLGDGWACAAKIESHNHPSAVEPLQGAATGLGGIMRDVLAMGARPAAFLDALRFGPLDDPRSAFLARGVVAGVGHYGNCVGVPTVGGDVYYHPSYQRNPLVNAMCVGFLRHGEMRSAAAAGDGNSFLLLGAATGRDGIGGAAFASVELQADAAQDRPRVQVGDPFFGKLLIEATLEILRELPVVAIQDLGAGGLAGAAIEMCHQGGVGAEIELAAVPLRAQDLTPPEILLSESQERMLLCLHPQDIPAARAVARRYGVEAAEVGRITAKPTMRFLYEGECLSELETAIYAEAPLRSLPETAGPRVAEKTLTEPPVARGDLLEMLSHPDLCDRSPIYGTYDQDVGLRTVVRPGLDAAVLRAAPGAPGVAVTTDQNPRLCAISARLGAEHAVAEAARNVMARGAVPIGLTNCLNLPSPEHSAGAAALRDVVAGIRQAALRLSLPVTGGNVSLYNEAEGVAIVPTPVIGMIGLLPDPERAIGVTPPPAGAVVLLLGDPCASLAGSVYAELKGLGEAEPAAPDYDALRRMADLIGDERAREEILLLHDVADGGLLVALAEVALHTGLGLDLRLGSSQATFLFGEPSAQFVALATRADTVAAAAARAGVACRELGRATSDGLIRVTAPDTAMEYTHAELRRAWRREA
jgi:phosphoribosylformylglycinamidine synthase